MCIFSISQIFCYFIQWVFEKRTFSHAITHRAGHLSSQEKFWIAGTLHQLLHIHTILPKKLMP